jgi:hypothetical protein
MILVTIEYDPDATILRGLSLFDLRDLTESVAGDVFEEEQSHVEVRIRPYTEVDQFERALSFTIDVSEDTVHHDLGASAKQFVVEIKDQMTWLPPFWVWTRRVPGSFVESN